MEKIIHINTDFGCVFLLNGSFVETADCFNYDIDNPLYVTVLPLSAHLLPYTAKIVGTKPIGNENLCTAFVSDDEIFIKLAPRYNYIYTSSAQRKSSPSSHAVKFFDSVKNGSLTIARGYLSTELNSTIDDDSLTSFFEDYSAIVKNDFSKKSVNENSGEFFLVNKNSVATLFVFDLQNGVIDNITEKSSLC